MYRALVDAAQRGDVESFDALARLVGDRCMGVAFRILRDTDRADDAVQAALIAAWRDLRALRDPERFEPWLHRILIRECYAEARRRRRWSADLHIMPTEVFSEAGGYQAVDDRDELDRAFRRLTLEQRAVVVLFHYLDLPMTEVAERVGVPVGTVKSRLYHATRAMRASMEADARTPIHEERPA